MKQMKFLAIAFTLLMSVAFTSCMDSDSNYKPTYPAIVQVSSGSMITAFKLGDMTLYPTSASLAAVETSNGFKPSSTEMAYIMYEYDAESADNVNSETTKKLTVDLKFAISIDATTNVTTEGAANDSVATAPIIELSKSGISENQDFTMVNDRFLLAGIDYYLSGQKAHTFTMIYYDDVPAEKLGELKLYLRHRSQEKEDFTGGNTSSIQVGNQYPSLYFYAFDLRSALNRYAQLNGGEPTTITVVADVNTNGVKLDTAEKKEYTITYKSEK